MSVKIGYLVRRMVAWNQDDNTTIEFYSEKDMPEEYLKESGVRRIAYTVIDTDD